MKVFFKIFTIALISILLTGCETFTQEMKSGVSFTNLKKVYVTQPSGLDFGFFMMTDEINTQVVEYACDYLKSKGFKVVDKIADAEIIFRPYWNIAIQDNNSVFSENLPIEIAQRRFMRMVDSNPKTYATLEIWACFPKDPDTWVWRGFSPIEMTPDNVTSALIKDQILWCLQYFPPEEYPSALDEFRKKNKIRKSEELQNPFNEVLIKERQKRLEEAMKRERKNKTDANNFNEVLIQERKRQEAELSK